MLKADRRTVSAFRLSLPALRTNTSHNNIESIPTAFQTQTSHTKSWKWVAGDETSRRNGQRKDYGRFQLQTVILMKKARRIFYRHAVLHCLEAARANGDSRPISHFCRTSRRHGQIPKTLQSATRNRKCLLTSATLLSFQSSAVARRHSKHLLRYPLKDRNRRGCARHSSLLRGIGTRMSRNQAVRSWSKASRPPTASKPVCRK